LINSGKFSPAIQNSLWEAIENHSVNVLKTTSTLPLFHEDDFLSTTAVANTPCKKECQSHTLNSIYESFLAKSWIDFERESHGRNVKPLFDPIYDALKAFPLAKYEEKREAWLSSGVEFYPVAQKKKKSREELIQALETKSDIPLLMDHFVTTYGFPRNPDEGSWVATKEGNTLDPYLKYFQDRCYTREVIKERGEKIFLVEPRRVSNQSGIVERVDIPELAMAPGAEAWKHSGATSKFKRDGTHYDQSARKAHIPIVCGISGTTNIALWSIFSLRVNLSPKELRLFLLTTWATLCADGGHSLQEILSASKIVANYIRHNEAHPYLPKTTLDSLNEVTHDWGVNGTESEALFGQHSEMFLKDIEKDYPDFALARARAQQHVNDYYKKSGCN
jgi:hypothetical protein